jgi:hypothetical protein
MSELTGAELRKLAVETDTRLAELDQEYGKLEHRRGMLLAGAHRAAGDHQDYVSVGRNRRVLQWRLDDAEVLGQLANALVGGGPVRLTSWEVPEVRELLHEVNAQDAAMEANRAEANLLERVHDEHGWSRFFLVLNNNGHIHYDQSNYRCSRTPTTQHGWNPALSGATEEEAVAELGPLLCTVCFPSAPVEWTIGKPKTDRCAGSGAYVRYTGPRRRTVYVECPECHETVTRTPSGLVRAHKPKA